MLWPAPVWLSVLSLVARSPLLACMEAMVGPEIAMPLSHCHLRAVTDGLVPEEAGLRFHQDVREVTLQRRRLAPDVQCLCRNIEPLTATIKRGYRAENVMANDASSRGTNSLLPRLAGWHD